MGSWGRIVNGKETVDKIKVKEKCWGDKPPLFRLNPCPKCGSTQDDQKVYTVFFGYNKADGKYGWKVICKTCKFNSTRFYINENDAVTEWNEKWNNTEEQEADNEEMQH